MNGFGGVGVPLFGVGPEICDPIDGLFGGEFGERFFGVIFKGDGSEGESFVFVMLRGGFGEAAGDKGRKSAGISAGCIGGEEFEASNKVNRRKVFEGDGQLPSKWRINGLGEFENDVV